MKKSFVFVNLDFPKIIHVHVDSVTLHDFMSYPQATVTRMWKNQRLLFIGMEDDTIENLSVVAENAFVKQQTVHY